MLWFLIPLAVALAAVAGYWLGRRPARPADSTIPLTADTEHVLDLLRRAHGAVVGVVLDGGPQPLVVTDPRRASAEQTDRGLALARVALTDERRHRFDDPATAVAAGHRGIGVALAFPAAIADDAAERAQADAWRLAAGIADQMALNTERARDGGAVDALTALGLSETVESAAIALCQSVAHQVDRATALVLRDEFSGVLTLLRVSSGADRRLEGTSALPGSAVARAVETDAPVAGLTPQELLGHPRSDRRRGIDAGLAFPVREGRHPVGALVVFGAPERLDADAREAVERLLFAAGPRVAHLQAVEAREVRARTDELTGLPNRRGLERAQIALETGCAALLIADLDHFKRVNDRYGHVAGDAALRHLADVLRRVLRSRDVAARIGGEEFALWLPEAGLEVAMEVAERVRSTVAGAPVHWNGQEIPLSCSVGVAAMPACTTVRENLYPAADAALYRAKERGRNRVEVAPVAQGPGAGP
ncbi:MAG: GGDEF domain-containing protein [Gemmatimonadota bacterium]|nr:GGDEF domain-containing protein [Gemmatimonadota bacterium]